MPRLKDGPTARIIEFAKGQPGSLVRWKEAEAIYDDWNPQRAWDNNRNNLNRIFTRHFVKVEGIRGYYVLRSSIQGDDESEVLVDEYVDRASQLRRMSEITGVA